MRTFFGLASGVIVATGAAAMLATTGGQALAATGTAVSPSISTGSNILTSVAVASSSNAWAVGWVAHGVPERTLIEHWNGKAWKIVPSPSPGGATGQSNLYGVDVRSSAAWTVGQYWNGKAWQTLTEHWNGKAWQRVPSPNPGGSSRTNYLSRVAYISRSQAWAVGDYSTKTSDQALIERWNGRAWKVVPSPRLPWSYLQGIAVLSPKDAWAVGSFSAAKAGNKTLIEHWNGKTWKRVPSPSPGSTAQDLKSITATSSSNAWAVGWYDVGTTTKSLILHWNGRSWKRVASPDPSGSVSYSELQSVTAASSSRAWAVGSYSPAIDTYLTLILRWNGRFWKPVKSPSPDPTHNTLWAVAMTRSAAPWAVGNAGPGTPGTSLTLTEHLTAGGWSQVASPSK
jgi:hypothetical protein